MALEVSVWQTPETNRGWLQHWLVVYYGSGHWNVLSSTHFQGKVIQKQHWWSCSVFVLGASRPLLHLQHVQ